MQEVLPGEAPESARRQDSDAPPGLRLTDPRIRLPVALLVAASSGAFGSLALPPANVGPVALVALIPLIWLVRETRPGRGAVIGFVWGFAYFGALLYWIVLFTRIGWFALTIASAAAVALFGLVAPLLWRNHHPLRSAAGLAAAWT